MLSLLRWWCAASTHKSERHFCVSAGACPLIDRSSCGGEPSGGCQRGFGRLDLCDANSVSVAARLARDVHGVEASYVRGQLNPSPLAVVREPPVSSRLGYPSR